MLRVAVCAYGLVSSASGPTDGTIEMQDGLTGMQKIDEANENNWTEARVILRRGLLSHEKAAEKHTMHTAIILRGNGSDMIIEALRRRPWWRIAQGGQGAGMNGISLWWGGNGQAFDFAGSGISAANRPRQLVNKFHHNAEICVKARLALNLRRYAKAANIDLASILPMTFVVKAGSNDKESSRELTAFRAQAAEHEDAMWIVKPSNRNRGFGIEVLATPKAVEGHLKQKKPGSTWVIQRYIKYPLLIGGRKFDVRQYVLVTPDFRVYMYKDSYVRTSSTSYDATDLEDRSIHLTNDYVQKHLDTYGAHEDANKLSFSEFQAVLDKTPLQDGRIMSAEDDLWPAMKHCIRHTFSCAMPHLAGQKSSGCSFEVFGLDFMIDGNGQVVLIEVNTSPALLRHGRHLTEMLPRLIEEIFQKAVDPVCPPPVASQQPQQTSRDANESGPAVGYLDQFELVDVPSPPIAGSRIVSERLVGIKRDSNAPTPLLPPIGQRARATIWR